MFVTALVIILGLLPGLAWLAFYLREDLRHPEPKKLIFYAFLGGALITVFVLQAQIFIHDFLVSLGYTSYGFTAFLLLGGAEEFFKFLAVYLVVSKRKEFNEPLDAMIYMIVASLGFATVENVASILQTTSLPLGSPGPLETTILRFVGATLLHTLSSGLVGYYWGKAMVKKSGYAGMITRGLLIATLLHAIFNYLIMKSEPVAVPLVFLVFVALFILYDFEKLKQAEV